MFNCAVRDGFEQAHGDFFDSIIAQILPFRIGGLVCKLRSSIFVCRHKSLVLLGVFSMSLTVQFARILVYWAAGLSVGLQISLIYFIGFQPVAAVISELPISIGGLGIRENIFVELWAIVEFFNLKNKESEYKNISQNEILKSINKFHSQNQIPT